MVDVAQLVRASVCGTEGRGFESRYLPQQTSLARVAELADALDLGSSVLGRGGSSPPSRTK